MKIARPLKAIRLHCLDCSGWSSKEVELCPATKCALYHLRFGRKPKGGTYSRINMDEYRREVEKK